MKKLILSSLSVSVGLFAIQPAEGAVLIEVDVLDPSNVIFTATIESSTITDNSALVADGVTLLGLFTTPYDTIDAGFLEGDFTQASLESTSLNELYNGYSYGTNDVSFNDLTIFNFDSGDTMAFSTTGAAFTGTSSVDVTGATFESVGYIGDIVIFDPVSETAITIGSYEVVPEPSVNIILSLGLLGCLSQRKRR